MKLREHDNFDEFAKDYDSVHSQTLRISGANRDYFSEYKIREVARHENTQARLSILDFGCGDGNSVKHLRTFFPNAILNGTDVSELSISEAKEKRISTAHFQSYDGTKLPFEDGQLDIVFTSMVFHHISFNIHDRILKEIHRVLKPGGRFYIFEHNPLNPVTRKIVRECAFDHDAILLPYQYTNKMVDRSGFTERSILFTLFLPRHWMFRWLLWSERFIQWIPIGAQYYVRAVK